MIKADVCTQVEKIDPASAKAKPMIDAVAPEKVIPGDAQGATFRQLSFAYRLQGWVVLLAQYNGEEDLYALLRPDGNGYRYVTDIPIVEASDADRLGHLKEKAPDAPEAVLHCLLMQPFN
jgi:hypothetical protein